MLSKSNILIDQSHHARLADPGLPTIVSNLMAASSYTRADTARWMSPELLDPGRSGFEESRRTKQSDCYALGMAVLEVLTGRAPFSHYNGSIVMQKVIEGERPGRPRGTEGVWFTDGLWETLELCWLPQPEGRPTIEVVLGSLGCASTTLQPPPPSADGGTETGTNGELFLGLGYVIPSC